MAKKQLILFPIVLILMSLSARNVQGQEDTIGSPNVKKSTDKVLIGGKVFFIHLVKEGQTLYSIAKAYNVSEDAIAKENVDVLYGPLQVGQALKIPVNGPAHQEIGKKDRENFQLHLVKPNQTLYFLSRKYNVAVDTIVKYNPETELGNLGIDQVIRIPKKSINTRERRIPKDPKSKYLVHEVEPKETLYSLSKKYSVSIDMIMDANPFLKNQGLQAGQNLKMPVIGVDENIQEIPDSSYLLVRDTLPVDDQRIRVEFHCRGSNPDRFRTYKVALLLPFELDTKYELKSALDTITGDSPAEIQAHPVTRMYRKFISENNYFYEFYEGTLIALDSLKKLGFKTEFHVFDTEKNPNTVKRNILPKLRTFQPDLIIGPIYQENLKVVSDFSLKQRIPFVSPIFKNPWLVETNPYLFQVIPEDTEEIKEASDFISRFTNRNIILIHRGDSLFVNNIYDFRDNLYRSVGQSSEDDNIIINELIYNDSLKPDISDFLKRDMPNLIVIPSPREVYAIPLLTKLNQLTKYYDIQVFGTSQWQQFKNVDDDYFYNLRVHYYTPFYIDYDDRHVKSFIAKYRNWYNHEPVQTTPKGYNFSYLGYDITFYFLNALRIYGTNFPGCLEYYNPRMLMSNYQFQRDDVFSGFTNNAISIIRFNTDFTVAKLDIMRKIKPRWDLGRNK